MGPQDATVRVKLLDAAERVLGRDGYPAVSSRNVGKEAGVNQKLVFYYFQNMEELVVATFRRRSEAFLAQLEALQGSASPVRSLWTLISHRSGRLVIEFMAMANRNEALKQELAAYSARANQLINAVLARPLAAGPQTGGTASPAVVNFALASLARNLILEGELGLLDSPAELNATIEKWIDELDSRVAAETSATT
jgi:AcrR family transcriptional regulator